MWATILVSRVVESICWVLMHYEPTNTLDSQYPSLHLMLSEDVAHRLDPVMELTAESLSSSLKLNEGRTSIPNSVWLIFLLWVILMRDNIVGYCLFVQGKMRSKKERCQVSVSVWIVRNCVQNTRHEHCEAYLAINVGVNDEPLAGNVRVVLWMCYAAKQTSLCFMQIHIHHKWVEITPTFSSNFSLFGN